MSIFPKRAVQGSSVVIHWNFNTSQIKEQHVLPWVRIGVQDPDGKLFMLFEEHVLGLPDPVEKTMTSCSSPQLKYLNKNVPLLLLADYLSGAFKREKLVEILENIQSGRHYYFTFDVPQNAPLGKYKLISELHMDGIVRHSKTAPDDFFFIEKVSCRKVGESGRERYAVIVNHSREKTPVKLVGCRPAEAGTMRTTVNMFELEPLEERLVPLATPLNFLLYNEERQVIPLQAGSPGYLLRNQQVLQINKKNGRTYLLKKDREAAYHLTKQTKSLWQKSDGLLNIQELKEGELKVYEELKTEGLITELRFES
ncbi:hypothetical protein AAG747_12675 [Rapidithrix thailandica]|uniref:Uncharacterized protein n=1 Tax=Rapidithrix thailandica TaxID=413964 RepID=A0AAW9S5L9_9BACT